MHAQIINILYRNRMIGEWFFCYLCQEEAHCELIKFEIGIPIKWRMLRYSNTLVVNTFIKRLVSVLPSAGATMESLPTPVLVAFGIPTIDFSFLVSDKSIIEKYELNIDSQREMTDDLLELIKLEFHEWVPSRYCLQYSRFIRFHFNYWIDCPGILFSKMAIIWLSN